MQTVSYLATALLVLSLLTPAWTQAAPAPADTALAAPETTDDMGAALPADRLDDYRGGTEVNNLMHSDGVVADATAVNIATGANSVSAGAFAQSSGMPMVIQNSGANVLIQNSTIVNVQFR